MNKKCIAITKRGTPCRAKPLQGSELCLYHDPNTKRDRTAASAVGGKAGKPRTLPPDAPYVTVRTPEDACKLIEATINQVLRGAISHQVANSVAILLNLQLKTVELQIEAERIGMLEAEVER